MSENVIKINTDQYNTNDKIKNDKLTPITYLKNNVYIDVPTTKHKKVKVKVEEFEILEFGEQWNLVDRNYNVSQLKTMCKYHNLKRTGNKKELLKRVYNYLYFSQYAVAIQKTFRMYLVRRFIQSQGDAVFNRDRCVNDTDFYTLDSIKEIPHQQFISYKDAAGFHYGFNVCSLYQLLKVDKHETKNPYTREIFPQSLIRNMCEMIRIAKILKYDINVRVVTIEEYISEDQRVELNVTRVFQQIDALGNYTDQAWFLDLNQEQLITYVKQLHDIWSYRAQLTNDVKRSICPPIGNPFRYLPSLHRLRRHNLTRIRRDVLRVIEMLVFSGIDNSYKNLGAYYSLAALTLVSQNAATALPWLYESVA